ncbi:MAG TPA: cysteine peptidase family C39 domain-containing protein [Candidatus Paceibacterota bacterium]|nr:cysteine peptidase family C39 domain-containing protein [Candidatus Paceibacterota bacterium]
MKINPLKQPDDTACGPTSIQMIAEYFHTGHTFADIASVSEYIKKDGLSNADLLDTLSALGFSVRSKHDSVWSDLVRNNTSDKVIIVSWMLHGYIGHFSVVNSIDKNSITLAEPESGTLVTMEKIIFMRLWMDYDDLWYPVKSTDIQLRWMCTVTQKRKTRDK